MVLVRAQRGGGGVTNPALLMFQEMVESIDVEHHYYLLLGLNVPEYSTSSPVPVNTQLV